MIKSVLVCEPENYQITSLFIAPILHYLFGGLAA